MLLVHDATVLGIVILYGPSCSVKYIPEQFKLYLGIAIINQ